uniref:Ig-like domain-containing protein n=1 Tax=Callorhinchus milii TaxID=7868 RepID=A0A4W3IQ37_CALMI
ISPIFCFLEGQEIIELEGLTIPNIKEEDGGMYRCKAVNALGEDYLESTQDLRGAFSDTDDYLDQGLVSADRCASRTSSINSWSENLKPSFTQKLKFKSVMEGEQATFECKLVASPAPKIAWFHNNRPIRKDLRKNFKIESAMHIHSSSLEINNVEQKDSGSYKVFAINSEGSAETTASLLSLVTWSINRANLTFIKNRHNHLESIARQNLLNSSIAWKGYWDSFPKRQNHREPLKKAALKNPREQKK